MTRRRRWPSAGLALEVENGAVERMLAESMRRTEADGTVLGYPGDGGTSVFWVIRGTLAIYLEQPDGTPVAELTEGQCAGDLAALHEVPRSAWIVAKGLVEVEEIPSVAFLTLIRGSHQAALNLLMMQASRVRQSSAALLTTTQERDRIQRNAVVDPLTNLQNRRWIDQMLPRQLQRAQTDGEPLSVVLIDVDHFKRVNDKHGHDAGDHVLVQVALEMRRRFRPNDHLCRYGGEELIVILPKANLEGARQAADRFRASLAFTGLVMPDGRALPRVTVSAGVAEARPNDTAAELLRRADQAMYAAKRAGRNRVFTERD